MPLLRLETTVVVPETKQNVLLSALSKLVAESIGKPEQYVMVAFHRLPMQMSGKPGDAAFVDVRSIGGLSSDVNRCLSQRVCELLKEHLGISPERVYLNFTDVKAGNWGWNGATFG